MKLDFCCICGTKENLHHHHIIPRFRGGSDDETNQITLCGTHHAWIHGLQPTSWNNHGNAVKESLKEAKKLGISIYKMKKSPAKAAQTGRAIVRRERHMI